MEKEKKTPTIIYVEPFDYFPEELRKEYGLGEYARPEDGADAQDAEDGEHEG